MMRLSDSDDSAQNRNKKFRSCSETPLDPSCSAGKIKKILIMNFMCHGKLEFSFGDNINFISGKNGSGKSAILTAVMLGLGGKVIDTKRGTSLKCLIKSGKGKCVIRITLSNSIGKLSRPYKHENYGDEITIIRSISEKSSSYKLLASDGSIVDHSFGELKKILGWFNIQVNNPVAILTQETARTFMTSADPRKLYEFFMKGTLLEHVKQKYNWIKEEKMPIIDVALNAQKEHLEMSSKDIIETKKNLSKLEELHRRSVEIEEVKKELVWAEVKRLEEIVDEEEQLKMEGELELGKLKKIVEEREVVEINLEEKKKKIETNLEDISQKLESLYREIDGCKNIYANKQRDKHSSIQEIRRLHKQIEQEEKNCKELENEIEKERNLNSEAEARRKKNEGEKLRLRCQIEELGAVKKVNENDRQQFIDTAMHLREKVLEKERISSKINSHLGHKLNHLNALEKDRNELSVFSSWMPTLVNVLERETRKGKLSKMPRGPIGKYVKVSIEEWTPAIENLLSSQFLKSFCLNKYEDWQTFREAVQECRIPIDDFPQAIIREFVDVQQFNTKPYEVRHPGYMNLMDVITFSDPFIANTVIDNKEIENVLLIPSPEDACHLLGSSLAEVPKNCGKALTLAGDLIYPLPGYRFYSGRKDPKKVKYLQVNTENATRVLKEEVAKLREDSRNAEEDLRSVRNELNINERKINALGKSINNMFNEITHYELELARLDKEEDISDMNINTYKEEIEYRKNLIAKWKVTIEEKEAEQENQSVRITELENNLKLLKKSKSTLKSEKSSVEGELSGVKSELTSITQDWKTIKINYSEKQKSMASFSQKLLEKKESLKGAKIKAMQICPKIEETREIKFLKVRMAELNNIIKTLEGLLHGTVLSVTKEYESKLDDYERIASSLHNLYSVTEELKHILDDLKKRYDMMRRLTCSSIKDMFLIMLSFRGYKGSIIFDHENKELNINVKTDHASNVADACGLSGGERSFCMVSFIMALWKNMNLPFYFLDEFDVFMDPVNRQTALHLLVDHAKDRPYQQFIFLTPHSNSYESLKDKIAFFRLEDPRL